MEPRPLERGNHEDADEATRAADLASMEPRPLERGNINLTRNRVHCIFASMEPRPLERGNSPKPGYYDTMI